MRQFFRDTSGAVSVEFCLWLIVLVAVIMLAADGTILLTRQSEMIDVAREIARQISIGTLAIEDVDSVLNLRWPNSDIYTATVEEDGDFFAVSITVSFADVLVFGDNFVANETMEGRVVMTREVPA